MWTRGNAACPHATRREWGEVDPQKNKHKRRLSQACLSHVRDEKRRDFPSKIMGRRKTNKTEGKDYTPNIGSITRPLYFYLYFVGVCQSCLLLCLFNTVMQVHFNVISYSLIIVFSLLPSHSIFLILFSTTCQVFTKTMFVFLLWWYLQQRQDYFKT